MTPFTTVAESILDAVGSTPLVELRRSVDGCDGRVLAKLEFVSPGGGGKGRVARQLLRDARRDGRLSPHGTVVGDPLGGGSLALAMACAALGHPFVSVELGPRDEARGAHLSAFGTEVVWLESAEVERGPRSAALLRAREHADEIARQRGAFRADLLTDLGGFRAHRLGTGQELLNQSAGDIDVFCDLVGTGATLAGCAAALKEYRRDVTCYAVEPRGAAALACGHGLAVDHPFPGVGYGLGELPLLDPSKVDGYLEVDRDEAQRAVDDLARREGIHVDLASGANVAAARRILQGPRAFATVAIVLAGRSA